MATLNSASRLNNPEPGPVARMVIPASIVWNLVIMAGSILLSVNLFQGDEFADLGLIVQQFMAIVALVPAVLAVASTVQILRGQASGRYLAATLNFLGAVLGGAAVLHMWGVFLGFDAVAAAVFENVVWLWAIAAAYMLFWLAGRLDEYSVWRNRLEKVALGLGMLFLVILLLSSDVLNGILSVLGTYARLETWLATLVLVISGVLVLQLLKLGRSVGETPDQQRAWQGWLMLSPNLIGFLMFFAGPLLLSFYLGFTDSTGVTVPKFVGLQNYADIVGVEIQMQDDLTAQPQSALEIGYVELFSVELGARRMVVGVKDFLFWYSLRNTVMYCLLLIPLSMLPALGLSLVLNSSLPGMRFYRALYFLPSVAAVVGTALIWRWLYNTQVGYVNHAISQIVIFLNNTFGAQIMDPQIQWLSNPGFQLVALVVLGAWQIVGFNTVIFLAGLQGIPRELYEAAFVDGANAWHRFRSVTLPLLAPTTFFVAVTTIITGLQVFNEPYALISVRPMPLNATTSVYYLYTRGFFRFEFGYASSVAWIVFALIFVVTLLQFRIQRSGAFGDQS